MILSWSPIRWRDREVWLAQNGRTRYAIMHAETGPLGSTWEAWAQVDRQTPILAHRGSLDSGIGVCQMHSELVLRPSAGYTRS